MDDIPWGSIHFDDEVRDWILHLSEGDYGRVEFYVGLLAARGPLLAQPHSKHLVGKLRELRFYLGSEAMRLTYWIAPGRKIIMLTVFKKTKRREAAQVMRARRALWVCQENHEHEIDRGD
jgi:hypothetical protein